MELSQFIIISYWLTLASFLTLVTLIILFGGFQCLSKYRRRTTKVTQSDFGLDNAVYARNDNLSRFKQLPADQTSFDRHSPVPREELV